MDVLRELIRLYRYNRWARQDESRETGVVDVIVWLETLIYARRAEIRLARRGRRIGLYIIN